MAKASSIIAGILVLCCLEGITNAEYKLYKDPKQPVNRRIKDLLGRMSLEEKIGQMALLERTAASPQVMEMYSIGEHIFIWLTQIKIMRCYPL